MGGCHMPIWLRRHYPAGTNYTDARDLMEKLLVSTGKHQEMMMVCERVGDGIDETVYIWLDNSDLADIFPEFEPSLKPASPRPKVLIAESGLYDRIFPKKNTAS